jgi:hypothetical protein
MSRATSRSRTVAPLHYCCTAGRNGGATVRATSSIGKRRLVGNIAPLRQKTSNRSPYILEIPTTVALLHAKTGGGTPLPLQKISERGGGVPLPSETDATVQHPGDNGPERSTNEPPATCLKSFALAVVQSGRSVLRGYRRNDGHCTHPIASNGRLLWCFRFRD